VGHNDPAFAPRPSIKCIFSFLSFFEFSVVGAGRNNGGLIIVNLFINYVTIPTHFCDSLKDSSIRMKPIYKKYGHSA
jgi:hypothetical protein